MVSERPATCKRFHLTVSPDHCDGFYSGLEGLACHGEGVTVLTALMRQAVLRLCRPGWPAASGPHDQRESGQADGTRGLVIVVSGLEEVMAASAMATMAVRLPACDPHTDLAWIASQRGLVWFAAQQADDAVVLGSLFRSVTHTPHTTGRLQAPSSRAWY